MNVQCFRGELESLNTFLSRLVDMRAVTRNVKDQRRYRSLLLSFTLDKIVTEYIRHKFERSKTKYNGKFWNWGQGQGKKSGSRKTRTRPAQSDEEEGPK